jgi:hypothetical protein
MNGEATRFKPGDKAAEKWTEEEAYKAFMGMFEYTISNEDIVSVQQAYLDYKMPSATYYYLTNKFPYLESIKRGISDIIISRVNKGAITNNMNSTACIWRMKQLGETDKQEVKTVNTNLNVELDDKEREEAIKRVKKGLNEFEDYE